MGNEYPQNLTTTGSVGKKFLVSERLKKQEYKRIYSGNYFWGTWEGQEIDWVEERDGKVFGTEFKWKKSTSKSPPSWLTNYPNATF